jgi:hypothetical protein
MMGKYSATETAIFSVFDSTAWGLELIATFPNNFTGTVPGNEYLRLDIVTGGEGVNLKSTRGQLIIDIFTPAGNGPSRASAIADRLDAFLLGKSKSIASGTLQFLSSAFTPSGLDRANPALYRSTYVVNFTFSGV